MNAASSRRDSLLALCECLALESFRMPDFESGETSIHFVGGVRDDATIDVIFLHGLGGHANPT